MKEPFSYEDASRNAYSLLLMMTQRCRGSLPVYSGDVALALRLSHRSLKQVIEARYRVLQSSYGRKVHRVHQKRGNMMRSLNGYILPLQAALQLVTLSSKGHHCLLLPEILFVSYSGAGVFLDSLN